MDTLIDSLQTHFSFDTFRAGQRETIERLINGESTLCIFPTGAGKSLCYQLPSILLKGKTSLVISPLISLIQDQIQQLQDLGIEASAFHSSLSENEWNTTLKKVEAQEVQLLFTTPESLLKKECQQVLKSLEIGIVAVDEAHCVSEWGNSFRPSYLLLAAAIRKLKPHAILALTATATKEVARDIRSRFKIKTKDQIQTPLYRSNLEFSVIPCHAEQKINELIEILNKPEHQPAIIYVMKQVDAEEVCAALQKEGLKARAYHAGMHADARKLVQEAFIANTLPIVVATIAFGMGVNKPNIRTVVHYHLPKSPEGWVQECGRAGRDGKTSQCVLLGCNDDLIPLTNFIHADSISKNAIERIIEMLFAQGKNITFSKYHICREHDITAAKLDIILSFLINQNYLTVDGTSWRYFQISRLRYTTHEFGRTKQPLVNAIHEHCGKIDSSQSMQLFKISRTRLLSILTEMEEVGDVAVKQTGLLHHYLLKQVPADLSTLIQELNDHFLQHNQNAFKRLEAVIGTATTRSCIPARLVKYFGDSINGNCGSCSSCRGEKRARKLPGVALPSLTQEEVARMQEVYKEHKKTLSTALRLTRFFCGIFSPGIQGARLYQHEHFGSLIHVPFSEILTQSKVIIG